MKTNMSLTKEQKQNLDQLSTYFRKLEKLALKKGIDLDVFISEYKDDSYAVYATENIKEKTDNRKKVFEKAGKEKSTDKNTTSTSLSTRRL
jgi:hypothetical protein